MKLELSHNSKYTTTEGMATERGRESTLTARHSCHRPRIPFRHVLIERRCARKHCKRGCNKEKERPIHHKQQQKYRFIKHKNKKNRTCENKCGPMTLELLYIQNTQQRKAWPQREGERVHLLSSILVTAPVFHLDKSALKVPKL